MSDFGEPFRQDTSFMWANVPLLSLFSPSPPARPALSTNNIEEETIQAIRERLSLLNDGNFSSVKNSASRHSLSEENKRVVILKLGREDLRACSCHKLNDTPQGSPGRGGTGNDECVQKNQEGFETNGFITSAFEELPSTSDCFDETQWKGPYKATEEPQVPFRTQHHDIEKCFRTQMEVSCALNVAFQQLSTMERQVHMLRAEQRTTELVARLRSEKVSSSAVLAKSSLFFTPPSGMPPSFPMQLPKDCHNSFLYKAVPRSVVEREEHSLSAVFNPIKNILDSFSRPQVALSWKNERLTHKKEHLCVPNARVEIVRSKQTPQPYKIIRWVPQSPPPSYLSSSSDDLFESFLLEDRNRKTGVDVVSEIHRYNTTCDDAYTDDFEWIEESKIMLSVRTESSLGHFTIPETYIETDISKIDSFSDSKSIAYSPHSSFIMCDSSLPVQCSTSTILPSDGTRFTPTNSASSLSDEAEDSDDTIYVSEKIALLHDSLESSEKQLFEGITKELNQACYNSNLIVSGIPVDRFQSPDVVSDICSIREGNQKQGRGLHLSSDIGSGVSQELLKDLNDLRRLQRIEQRLEDYLKDLSLHRSIYSKPQDLPYKVQRLSRVRQHPRENLTVYLRDITSHDMIKEDNYQEGPALEASFQVEDEVRNWLHGIVASSNEGSEVSQKVTDFTTNDKLVLNIDLNTGFHIDEEIIDELDNLSHLQKDGRKPNVHPDDFGCNMAIVDDILKDSDSLYQRSDRYEGYVVDNFEEASKLFDDINAIDLPPDGIANTIASVNSLPSIQPLKRSISIASHVSSAIDSSSQGANISFQYTISSCSPTSCVDELEGVGVSRKKVTVEGEQVRFAQERLRTSPRRSKTISHLQPVQTFAQLYNPHTPSSIESSDSPASIASSKEHAAAIHGALNISTNIVDKAEELDRGLATEGLLSPWNFQCLSRRRAINFKVKERPCSPVENVLPLKVDDSGRKQNLNCILFSKHNRYIEEELVAWDVWKGKQVARIKRLLFSLAAKMEGQISKNDTNSGNKEENTLKHFKVFETLLENRLGSKQSTEHDRSCTHLLEEQQKILLQNRKDHFKKTI